MTHILIKGVKKILTLIMLLWIVSCSKDQSGNPVTPPTTTATTLDKNEATSAYLYLNKVRANPSGYSQEIGVNLDAVIARQQLIWNTTLQQVAETKASDMATRNYFAHVDPDGYGINYYINKAGYSLLPEWLTDPKANNFESIAAAYKTGVTITGVDLIKQLIVDKDVADLGHRKHLLGIDDPGNNWYSTLIDIGIGFARNSNSTYQNYICVIIAKHTWGK